MGLRIRLSLIASLLFMVGMVFGGSFLVSNARQRVIDEVQSSATLAFQLTKALIGSNEDGSTGIEKRKLLNQLLAVEDARHITITVENTNDETLDTFSTARKVDAPDWFADRVMPPPMIYRITIGQNGETLVIRSNAADEVGEVWRETRIFLVALLLILLLLNTTLYVVIGRWFKPVATIVKGLEYIEKGDYSGRIEVATLPELNLVAEKLNQLNAVLKESQEENNRLLGRGLIIQEEERRRLARELHDELGQSISAIKAIAFSIMERVSDLDAKSAEGANKIGAISENVRDHIRSMMRRLRPTVLDELGLVPALEQMVDEWNDHHTDCFCSFNTTGNVTDIRDADTCINLYRIVQESLTNVASHAGAEKVEINLACTQEDIKLVISDNGCGFDIAAMSLGMGLNNIRERVRAMKGIIDIQSTTGAGTRLDLTIPRQLVTGQ